MNGNCKESTWPIEVTRLQKVFISSLKRLERIQTNDPVKIISQSWKINVFIEVSKILINDRREKLK